MKKTSCCSEVGAFETGANKLQPFYLQTGSGSHCAKWNCAKMKNKRISLFFISVLYVVIWGLWVWVKYLHVHVCAHDTYMDMHKPCVWIPVVFIFIDWERVHFIFVYCCIWWHSRFSVFFFKTCETFNPCCLKFTSLSTANFLALNKVQCSILSHLYQTVGAGICGFRNNTIEEDPSSKYFMFSCICLTNVLSHEFNQHYGTHSYTTQLTGCVSSALCNGRAVLYWNREHQ